MKHSRLTKETAKVRPRNPRLSKFPQSRRNASAAKTTLTEHRAEQRGLRKKRRRSLSTSSRFAIAIPNDADLQILSRLVHSATHGDLGIDLQALLESSGQMAHPVLLHDCCLLDGAMGQLDSVLGDVVVLQGVCLVLRWLCAR
jgi:hypothetical protein